MADPMKIRAEMKGDTAEIRVLMAHPMETGQRKDSKGQVVPAHFIKSFTATIGGKVMVEGHLNTAVSRNPVIGFRVKGARQGDKVVVSWVDNKGDQRSDETTIA